MSFTVDTPQICPFIRDDWFVLAFNHIQMQILQLLQQSSIFSSFASVFGTIDSEEYCGVVVANIGAIGDGVIVGYTGVVGKVLVEGTLVICGIDCIVWIGCATWVVATKGFELQLLPTAPKVEYGMLNGFVTDGNVVAVTCPACIINKELCTIGIVIPWMALGLDHIGLLR